LGFFVSVSGVVLVSVSVVGGGVLIRGAVDGEQGHAVAVLTEGDRPCVECRWRLSIGLCLVENAGEVRGVDGGVLALGQGGVTEGEPACFVGRAVLEDLWWEAAAEDLDDSVGEPDVRVVQAGDPGVVGDLARHVGGEAGRIIPSRRWPRTSAL